MEGSSNPSATPFVALTITKLSGASVKIIVAFPVENITACIAQVNAGKNPIEAFGEFIAACGIKSLELQTDQQPVPLEKPGLIAVPGSLPNLRSLRNGA